jgi:hypothetical protein
MMMGQSACAIWHALSDVGAASPLIVWMRPDVTAACCDPLDGNSPDSPKPAIIKIAADYAGRERCWCPLGEFG